MKKIISDGMLYVTGELAVKMFPFLLLPFLSRVLGPAGYAEISLFNTYVAVLFIFIGINSSVAITRFEFTDKQYPSSYFFWGGGISATIITIIFLFGASILKNPVLIFSVIGAYLQVVYTNLLSIKQCKKETRNYIVTQLFNAFFSFALTIIFLNVFSADYKLRVYAVIIGYIISIFLSMLISYHWLKIGKDFFANVSDVVKKLAIFGAPLIIHNLSFFARSGLDRILIDKYYSKFELGNYSAAFQLGMIITVVLMAINKAMTPHIYENLSKKKIKRADFFKIFGIYFLLCVFCSLVNWCIPEKIYTFILGDAYSGIKLFLIIMVPAFLSQGFYMLMSTTCFYFNKNKQVSVITFIGGVIHCIILYLTCKNLSVHFVPLVLLFSNTVISLLIYFSVFRKVDFNAIKTNE
ncbi:lipopolysaccharide biosynthesis protein [Superficieibacter sp. 1612_C1]|uniref:lipopolysaccharide biosynthesis protein n=1 Tax=Superficieibacter sp. 1612_C1 TaxID=2780382 RepID=UPI0018831DBA|nr:oligosaccharide flippase family protein [Superficieibacter sp. 1612_C1]